jgi:hypothetical protein
MGQKRFIRLEEPPIGRRQILSLDDPFDKSGFSEIRNNLRFVRGCAGGPDGLPVPGCAYSARRQIPPEGEAGGIDRFVNDFTAINCKYP